MLDAHAGRRAALITGAGLALFLPLFTAVLPAAGLDADGFNDAAKLDAFVRHHFAIFALPYLDGLVLHLAGLIAVLALYRRFAARSPWALPAVIAGGAWMLLDAAQNGTVLYAANQIVHHAAAPVAGPQLVLVYQLTTGLRLAAHVFGGLWILSTGVVALRHGGFSRGLDCLGVLAGALMTLNVIVPATQYPLFVLLPIWFVWLAIDLPRAEPESTPAQRAVPAAATVGA